MHELMLSSLCIFYINVDGVLISELRYIQGPLSVHAGHPEGRMERCFFIVDTRTHRICMFCSWCTPMRRTL